MNGRFNKLIVFCILTFAIGFWGCEVVPEEETGPEPVHVTSITLDQSEIYVMVNRTIQLTATVLPEDADNKDVIWSSADSEIAAVSRAGLVEGISPGTVTITAETEDGGYQGTCTVNVVITSVVNFDPESFHLAPGWEYRIEAEIVAEDPADETLEWSSDNSGVVTVDQGGMVHAVSAGTATVTVSVVSSGDSDSCEITVVESDTVFISVWDMGLSPYARTVFPVNEDGVYNFTIDWGDGSVELCNEADSLDHEYTADGNAVYTVMVAGQCDGFGFDYYNSYYYDPQLCLVDISQWGSLKMHNSGGVFYDCENLAGFSAADLPDLSGQTNLSYTFANCTLFNDGSIDSWDVSGVTDMALMFSNAAAFDQDLSGWDTSGVLSMVRMFSGTDAFNQDISGWDTGAVTSMAYMFAYTGSFDQNIAGWDTSNVLYMNSMFEHADAFNRDLAGWDTSKVVNMDHMFAYTTAFNGDISGWDTSSVTDMGWMFREADAFAGNLSGWYTANVTDMALMFYSANLFSSELHDWDTGNVTDMSSMFQYATSFESDLSEWDTTNVTDMGSMFSNATSFDSDLSDWETGKVTDMSYMFYNAESFDSDLSWDTSNVTNMSYMFAYADTFDGFISTWDTTKVTDMHGMFMYALSFDQIISEWDTYHVTNMREMFYHAASFTHSGSASWLDDWDTDNVTDMTDMFTGCPLVPLPVWYTP
ncbi:MAG: BspA family leucine-rich repeat surface protein [Spirochaetales bacterium]|nr:BspA family leucine-rich repeat surface protein [Spirochaetales bacterium]